MKKASSELFELLKSLSPSERKFFSQWSERHVIGDKNVYKKLYDQMISQTVYEEEALVQLFAGSPVADHFGVYKRQLYEKVCESLHHFHAAQHVRELLKRDLHIVSILTEKRLFAQADKLLRQSRKQMEAYELWESMPEWMDKKRALLAANAYQDATEPALASWQEAEAQSAAQLLRYGQFWLTGCRVARLHQQQIRPGDLPSQARLEAWMAAPCMSIPEERLSNRERLEKWSVLARYYFITRRPEEAYTYNLRQLELMDQHPKLVKLYPHRYVAVFHNLLIDSFSNHKLDELERRLQQWHELPARKELQKMPQLAQRTAELGLLLELNLLKMQGRWANVQAAWPRLSTLYTTTHAHMAPQRRMSCQYLMAYLCFRLGQWDESLRWQNLILQSGGRQVAEELFDFTSLLQLLTHYQLGHYEFLAYKLESVRRQYASGRPAGPQESLALRQLKRLINSPESEKTALLTDWRLALAELSDPRANDYFPFQEWLDQVIG